MKISARWPRPPEGKTRAALAVGTIAVIWLAPTALSVVLVALFVAWIVFRTTIEVTGGGFRPLRTTDLIEFASADQLDAHDQEQAMAEARRAASRPTGSW